MVQIESGRAQEPAGRIAERRREILEAASRLFRQRGLSATGMRDIAAELGVTAGSLYYYFESKQALLAFCQEETLAGLLARARATEPRGLPADQELYLLIVAHVVRMNEELPGSLAHLEIEALDERERRAVRARRTAYEHHLRRVIERGIASGVFRAVDPKLATFALLGAVNWSVKWFRPGGERSAGEVGAEFGELVVRGLLAPERAFVRPEVSA